MSNTSDPRLNAGLEEIVGGVAPPDMEGAIRKRLDAGERVGIAERPRASRWRGGLPAAAVLLCAASIAVAIGVLEGRSHDELTIRCVDVDGQPVSGAVVHVYQYLPDPQTKGRFHEFGPFRSNEEGLATCPVALSYDGGRHDRVVHACVPDRLVGCARSLSASDRNDRRPPAIEVKLTPSRTIAGTVILPPDSRAGSARVRIHSYYGPDGMQSSFPRTTAFPGMMNALSDLYESDTDAVGGFELRGIPVGGRMYLLADAEDCAQAQWANVDLPGMSSGPIPDQIVLRMQPAAILNGQVIDPQGAPVAGATVRLRASGPGIVVENWREASTNERGRFAFGSLPTSEVVVLACSETLRMQPKFQELESGLVTDSRLVLAPGITVRGMVLDEKTGDPVLGATVSAVTNTGRHSPLDHDRSNATGHFELTLPPGRSNLHFSSVPEGYAFPDPQIVEELDLDDSPPEPLTLRLERTR